MSLNYNPINNFFRKRNRRGFLNVTLFSHSYSFITIACTAVVKHPSLQEHVHFNENRNVGLQLCG